MLIINYYYNNNYKSHNNYCSVGVMELCLLNWLILFCVILTLVYSLRACHMWLTRNHMFIGEIWGKLTSFIFWNFEISNFSISISKISKISKLQIIELGKFTPNVPIKHVISSTNTCFINVFWLTRVKKNMRWSVSLNWQMLLRPFG